MKANALFRLMGASVLVLFGGGVGEARADVVSQAWPSPPRVQGPNGAVDTNKMIAVVEEPDGMGVNRRYTYTVGQTPDAGGLSTDDTIAVWKFDPSGYLITGFPLVWHNTGTSARHAYPVQIRVGGGTQPIIYVLGAFTNLGQGLDVVLLKYDFNGPGGGPRQVWYETYNNDSQNGDDYPVAMAPIINGAIWIAAASDGVGTGKDYLLLCYDQDGNFIVSDRYDNPTTHKSDIPVEIKLIGSPDGGVGGASDIVITGTSYDNTTKNDILTLEYTFNAGGCPDCIDCTPYPCTPLCRNCPCTLIRRPELRYTGSGGATDQVATSMDIWGLEGAHSGSPCSVFLPALYISGYTTESSNGAKDFLFLGYPRTTDAISYFARTTDGAGHGDDVAVKVVIAQSTDGYINAYLTGSTYTGGIAGYDVLTQAWTLVGVSRWSNVSNFGSDDRATDLAVFDVGNVYVTGKSFNGTDYDYRTFKLSSATGLPIWTIAYNVPGGGNDAGAAITLFTATPDTTLDEIYVTGRSAGFTESSVKYATIKYTETH